MPSSHSVCHPDPPFYLYPSKYLPLICFFGQYTKDFINFSKSGIQLRATRLTNYLHPRIKEYSPVLTGKPEQRVPGNCIVHSTFHYFGMGFFSA